MLRLLMGGRKPSRSFSSENKQEPQATESVQKGENCSPAETSRSVGGGGSSSFFPSSKRPLLRKLSLGNAPGGADKLDSGEEWNDFFFSLDAEEIERGKEEEAGESELDVGSAICSYLLVVFSLSLRGSSSTVPSSRLSSPLSSSLPSSCAHSSHIALPLIWLAEALNVPLLVIEQSIRSRCSSALLRWHLLQFLRSASLEKRGGCKALHYRDHPIRQSFHFSSAKCNSSNNNSNTSNHHRTIPCVSVSTSPDEYTKDGVEDDRSTTERAKGVLPEGGPQQDMGPASSFSRMAPTPHGNQVVGERKGNASSCLIPPILLKQLEAAVCQDVQNRSVQAAKMRDEGDGARRRRGRKVTMTPMDRHSKTRRPTRGRDTMRNEVEGGNSDEEEGGEEAVSDTLEYKETRKRRKAMRRGVEHVKDHHHSRQHRESLQERATIASSFTSSSPISTTASCSLHPSSFRKSDDPILITHIKGEGEEEEREEEEGEATGGEEWRSGGYAIFDATSREHYLLLESSVGQQFITVLNNPFTNSESTSSFFPSSSGILGNAVPFNVDPRPMLRDTMEKAWGWKGSSLFSHLPFSSSSSSSSTSSNSTKNSSMGSGTAGTAVETTTSVSPPLPSSLSPDDKVKMGYSTGKHTGGESGSLFLTEEGKRTVAQEGIDQNINDVHNNLHYSHTSTTSSTNSSQSAAAMAWVGWIGDRFLLSSRSRRDGTTTPPCVPPVSRRESLSPSIMTLAPLPSPLATSIQRAGEGKEEKGNKRDLKNTNGAAADVSSLPFPLRGVQNGRMEGLVEGESEEEMEEEEELQQEEASSHSLFTDAVRTSYTEVTMSYIRLVSQAFQANRLVDRVGTSFRNAAIEGNDGGRIGREDTSISTKRNNNSNSRSSNIGVNSTMSKMEQNDEEEKKDKSEEEHGGKEDGEKGGSGYRSTSRHIKDEEISYDSIPHGEQQDPRLLSATHGTGSSSSSTDITPGKRRNDFVEDEDGNHEAQQEEGREGGGREEDVEEGEEQLIGRAIEDRHRKGGQDWEDEESRLHLCKRKSTKGSNMPTTTTAMAIPTVPPELFHPSYEARVDVAALCIMLPQGNVTSKEDEVREAQFPGGYNARFGAAPQVLSSKGEEKMKDGKYEETETDWPRMSTFSNSSTGSEAYRPGGRAGHPLSSSPLRIPPPPLPLPAAPSSVPAILPTCFKHFHNAIEERLRELRGWEEKVEAALLQHVQRRSGDFFEASQQFSDLQQEAKNVLEVVQKTMNTSLLDGRDWVDGFLRVGYFARRHHHLLSLQSLLTEVLEVAETLVKVENWVLLPERDAGELPVVVASLLHLWSEGVTFTSSSHEKTSTSTMRNDYNNERKNSNGDYHSRMCGGGGEQEEGRNASSAKIIRKGVVVDGGGGASSRPVSSMIGAAHPGSGKKISSLPTLAPTTENMTTTANTNNSSNSTTCGVLVGKATDRFQATRSEGKASTTRDPQMRADAGEERSETEEIYTRKPWGRIPMINSRADDTPSSSVFDFTLPWMKRLVIEREKLVHVVMERVESEMDHVLDAPHTNGGAENGGDTLHDTPRRHGATLGGSEGTSKKTRKNERKEEEEIERRSGYSYTENEPDYRNIMTSKSHDYLSSGSSPSSPGGGGVAGAAKGAAAAVDGSPAPMVEITVSNTSKLLPSSPAPPRGFSDIGSSSANGHKSGKGLERTLWSRAALQLNCWSSSVQHWQELQVQKVWSTLTGIVLEELLSSGEVDDKGAESIIAGLSTGQHHVQERSRAFLFVSKLSFSLFFSLYSSLVHSLEDLVSTSALQWSFYAIECVLPITREDKWMNGGTEVEKAETFVLPSSPSRATKTNSPSAVTLSSFHSSSDKGGMIVEDVVWEYTKAFLSSLVAEVEGVLTMYLDGRRAQGSAIISPSTATSVLCSTRSGSTTTNGLATSTSPPLPPTGTSTVTTTAAAVASVSPPLRSHELERVVRLTCGVLSFLRGVLKKTENAIAGVESEAALSSRNSLESSLRDTQDNMTSSASEEAKEKKSVNAKSGKSTSSTSSSALCHVVPVGSILQPTLVQLLTADFRAFHYQKIQQIHSSLFSAEGWKAADGISYASQSRVELLCRADEPAYWGFAAVRIEEPSFYSPSPPQHQTRKVVPLSNAARVKESKESTNTKEDEWRDHKRVEEKQRLFCFSSRFFPSSSPSSFASIPSSGISSSSSSTFSISSGMISHGLSSTETLETSTWSAVGLYRRHGKTGIASRSLTTPYPTSAITTMDDVELIQGAATQKLYIPLPNALFPAFSCPYGIVSSLPPPLSPFSSDAFNIGGLPDEAMAEGTFPDEVTALHPDKQKGGENESVRQGEDEEYRREMIAQGHWWRVARRLRRYAKESIAYPKTTSSFPPSASSSSNSSSMIKKRINPTTEILDKSGKENLSESSIPPSLPHHTEEEKEEINNGDGAEEEDVYDHNDNVHHQKEKHARLNMKSANPSRAPTTASTTTITSSTRSNRDSHLVRSDSELHEQHEEEGEVEKVFMEGRVVTPPVLLLIDCLYFYNEYLAKYPSMAYIILPAMVELIETFINDMASLILDARAGSLKILSRITPAHISLAAQAFSVLADILPLLQLRLLRLLNLECFLPSSPHQDSLLWRSTSPSFFSDEQGRCWKLYLEGKKVNNVNKKEARSAGSTNNNSTKNNSRSNGNSNIVVHGHIRKSVSAHEEKGEKGNFSTSSGRTTHPVTATMKTKSSSPSPPREVYIPLSYLTEHFSRLSRLCEDRWKDSLHLIVRVIRGRLTVPASLQKSIEKGAGGGGAGSTFPPSSSSSLSSSEGVVGALKANVRGISGPCSPTAAAGSVVRGHLVVGGSSSSATSATTSSTLSSNTPTAQISSCSNSPSLPLKTSSTSSSHTAITPPSTKRWKEVGHSWILFMLKEMAGLLRLIRPILCGPIELDMVFAPLMGEIGRKIQMVLGVDRNSSNNHTTTSDHNRSEDGPKKNMKTREESSSKTSLGGQREGNFTALLSSCVPTISSCSSQIIRGNSTNNPSASATTCNNEEEGEGANKSEKKKISDEGEGKGNTEQEEENEKKLVRDEEEEEVDREREEEEEVRHDLMLFKVNAEKLGYDVLRCARFIFTGLDVLHVLLLFLVSPEEESNGGQHRGRQDGLLRQGPLDTSAATAGAPPCSLSSASCGPCSGLTPEGMTVAISTCAFLCEHHHHYYSSTPHGTKDERGTLPFVLPHYHVEVRRPLSLSSRGGGSKGGATIRLLSPSSTSPLESEGEGDHRNSDCERQRYASFFIPCSTDSDVFRYFLFIE